MSAARRRRRPQNEESDFIDDSNETVAQLPDDKIADVVQYLLISDRKKLPVKRADIVKHGLQGDNRLFASVFPAAIEHLYNMFGARVIQVDDKNAIQYILINALNNELQMVKHDNHDLANALLVPVLAVIFMHEGEANEDVISKFVSHLGLDITNTEAHIGSLNVSLKELLTSVWVKQLYIQHVKLQGNEQTEHAYRWGFRAHHQFSKMQMLHFVCKTLGNMKPQMWKTQYNAALAAESDIQQDEQQHR